MKKTFYTMMAFAIIIATAFAFATQQESFTVTYQSVPYGGLQSSGTIPQFDPSLGTLDAVEIEYRTFVLFKRQAENVDNNPASVSFGTDTVRLDVGDANASRARFCSMTLSSDSPSPNLGPYDGIVNWTGQSGITVYHVNGPVYSGTICKLEDPSDLSYFTGTGNCNVNLDMYPTYAACGGPTMYTAKSSQCGATVYFTYQYH